MCGIFGYVGNKNAIPLLIDGLKKLEYRGYDSAGICVSDGKKSGRTQTERQSGRIGKSRPIGFSQLACRTGRRISRHCSYPMGDARRAERNQFPSSFRLPRRNRRRSQRHHRKLSGLERIAPKEGHKFISQTDSEAVAHLVEKFYGGDLEKAVIKTLPLLEGAYGLAILHKKENRIIVAKKGSPLVIGVGKGEMFASSDVSAILKRAKKIIYLADGEEWRA